MGLKNIEKAHVLRLGDEVEYQQGQIVSKTLAQNRALSMTLFAFEQDEEISTHTADGDALVTVLDGTQPLHHRRRGAPRLRRGEHRHAGARAARGLWADALQDAADRDRITRNIPKQELPRTVRKPERRVGVLLIEIKVKADRCSHGRPKCDAAVWEEPAPVNRWTPQTPARSDQHIDCIPQISGGLPPLSRAASAQAAAAAHPRPGSPFSAVPRSSMRAAALGKAALPPGEP